MVIKYRPGKEMLLTDGLSRLPNRKNNKEVIDFDVKVDFVQFSTEKLTQVTHVMTDVRYVALVFFVFATVFFFTFFATIR